MYLAMMEGLASFIPKLIEIRIYPLNVDFFEFKQNMILKSHLKRKLPTLKVTLTTF